jgi:peptidoglycan/xylan/chitin deacetylase (PgdA/CDA1 family)
VIPGLFATPVTVAAAVIVYGAVNPRSELFGPTVRGTSSRRKVAITFDDGPNPRITPDLLKLLGRYQVRATFFVIGRFARQCPELMREIADRGHLIGNHTETHANLFWCRPPQICAEIALCNEALSVIIGAAPKWFRPPWGMRNPWVISNAAAAGLRTVMWSQLPGDWRGKSAKWLIPRMEPIVERAQKVGMASGKPATATGDILCLHDGDYRFLNGDRSATLGALEHWLPRWRDAGLEFVTIDGAVSDPA